MSFSKTVKCFTLLGHFLSPDILLLTCNTCSYCVFMTSKYTCTSYNFQITTKVQNFDLKTFCTDLDSLIVLNNKVNVI